MSKKIIEAGTIKKGDTVIIQDVACKVTGLDVSRPGKHGHAKIRMTGVGLIDGKKRQIVVPGHDKMEAPIIEKKTGQVLSITGDTMSVMDMESYETIELKIPEELKNDITEGVQILYWEILDDYQVKQVKSQ